MPAAIDMALRRTIVRERAAGRSYASLARQFGLAYNTVRTVCRRYVQEGESGLVPHYDACGPKSVKHDRLIYRAACALKRHHPRWGAALIRLKLEQRYSERPLPAVRTMQTWFKRAGLNLPRSKPPRAGKKAP